MIRVAILGAAGRMGRQVVRDALADAELSLAAAVDADNCPALGRDVGDLCGLPPCGVHLAAASAWEPTGLDVAIDFSAQEATKAMLPRLCQARVPVVVGTTGLDDDTQQLIAKLASSTPILVAPNLGIGVNLLALLLPNLLRALGEGYDAEIIEEHHRLKRDAPSGTALMLAAAIEGATGADPGRRVHGRKGLQPRVAGEIGIHAVRAGGNVGQHTVLLSAPGEEIRLTHRVFDSQAYSLGALRAAKWLIAQPPGLYGMQDVLADQSRERTA